MFKTLPVLYEDTAVLAVDKPAGLSSIPERYDDDGPSALSLIKAVNKEIFAVHRIDKETSGVLLFARNIDAFRSLSEQFEKHSLTKTYHTLVAGRPDWDEIVCDSPLLPDADRRHRTGVKKEGKPSETGFRVLQRYRTCSLIEASPKTGRTHQIRAHLSFLGFPVLCDSLYGDPRPLFLSSFKRGYRGSGGEEHPLLARLALHAASIQFEHPQMKTTLKIEAPYPRDMTAALNQLRKNT